MEKSFFSCLPNPSESTVRSVAVWMSDMLEQSKETVDKKTRKVVEFLETNIGMVQDIWGRWATTWRAF